MIPGPGTTAMVHCKEPGVQIRKKQVFTGLRERLGKYHLDLFVVIELSLEEQSLLLSMSKERRMNHENRTCVPGQVYLVLKRCKSYQFICSFLERIKVVKVHTMLAPYSSSVQ